MKKNYKFTIQNRMIWLLLGTVLLALLSSPAMADSKAASSTNDNLANATVIGAVPYTDNSVDNSTDTIEGSEVAGSCGTDGATAKSVWWSYTPASNGVLDVNTNGSSFDTILTIWTGGSHPLTEVNCDDDDGVGPQSLFHMAVTAGTTYYVRVVGFNGASGSVTLNVDFNLPSANNDLANAYMIVTVPYIDSSINNEFAIIEGNEVASSCGIDGATARSVWWEYMPASGGTLDVDTEGSGINDTVLSIWTGGGHPLTEVACDDDSGTVYLSLLSTTVTAGTTYYIRVIGLGSTFGDITLNADFTPFTLLWIWDDGGADSNWSTALNWDNNTVPSSGGTVQFDATAVTDSVIDSGFGGAVGEVVIDAAYTGGISFGRSLAVSGNYTQGGGTVTVDPAHAFTVDGTFTHSGGVLQETRTVGSNANMPFLQIETSGMAVQYRGVTLDTNTSGSDLGSTLVSVKAVDMTTEYCTVDGATSPAYAGRCFNITPANKLLPANVTLWALTSEAAGLTSASPYHYNGIIWQELTNVVPGTSGAYTSTSGDTTGFSPFLMAEAGGGGGSPTAVSLQSTSATSGTSGAVTAAFAAVSLVFGGLWLRLRRRTM